MRIRPATADDNIETLMMKAAGEISEVMFGTKNKKKIKNGFKYMFKRKGNRFSYENTYIAEEDQQIKGFIMCMPVKTLNQTTTKTTMDIIKWKKLSALLQVVTNLKQLIELATMKEGNDDEYHISLIAVDEAFQGQGIATKMLQFAEKKAKDEKFQICSLTVKKDNPGARKLYQKNGYIITGEIRKPFALYRMQKTLK